METHAKNANASAGHLQKELKYYSMYYEVCKIFANTVF